METKVVAELSQYEIICRNSREDFKNSVVNRDKEVNRKKQLELIKQRNVRDRLTNTDSEMMKSKLELNKCNKEVEEIVEAFEKRKLQDLKTVLMDFVQIEMKQHSKALEVLTATYQDLSDIDEIKDFKVNYFCYILNSCKNQTFPLNLKISLKKKDLKKVCTFSCGL